MSESTTAISPLALVVTADDFGIGVATSRGIIEAHLRGPVTATSLMSLTGDHVRASIPLLEQTPQLDVGLHVVLTACGEKPLHARPSSGLVNHHGEFFTNGQLWQRALLGKLDRQGVADEIAAQAEMFYKLMGRLPDYVDGHHHSHQLPIIRDALMEVIKHDILPPITRITVEPPGMAMRVWSASIKRAAARWMGRRAAAAFSKSWVWTNDSFFGMLSAADLSSDFPWKKYLPALPDQGVIEWVVHPGEMDESLIGRDTYRTHRPAELAALTSPAGIAAWEHLRPHLARKSVLRRKGTDSLRLKP